MSTQDIIEDAKPMTDDLRELMITNKALLGAVKDIQHMLQNEKQIPYPVTLITKQKDSFCTSSLNITHFIDDCQGCLEWISNPEEHLELDRRRKTLKMLWPSTTDDGHAQPLSDEVSQTYSIFICSRNTRLRFRHVMSRYEGFGSSDGSDMDFEDHFLSVARDNWKIFKDYASLRVPHGLHVSPKVERTWDLIQVKQPGSSAVSAQIRAILSYSPLVAERLKDYPKYGERLLDLIDFIDGHRPSNLRALWFNRGDLFQWYSIWATLMNYSLVLLGTLFALISLALSSVQTWAALEALRITRESAGQQ